MIGQLPELCHVQAFEKLTVVAGSIAEKAAVTASLDEVSQRISFVTTGECGAQCNRYSLGDKGEATEEVMLLREQVHRTPLPLLQPVSFPNSSLMTCRAGTPALNA